MKPEVRMKASRQMLTFPGGWLTTVPAGRTPWTWYQPQLVVGAGGQRQTPRHLQRPAHRHLAAAVPA